MQPTYTNGSKGPVEPYDRERFDSIFSSPNVSSMNVFKGEEVVIAGTRYIKDSHGTLHKLTR